ncbi:MAG: hypothetical protein R6X09_03925 [Bacteroidales bacterium]
MNNSTFFLLFLMVAALFAACNEDDGGEGDPNQPFVYQSLVAVHDTICSGETTPVTATASGYKLVYYWSASAGDILGSGAKVTYASSPCHVGTNQITCQVKDGNGASETKTITIVVE